MRWDTLDKFPTSRLGRLRHCVTHRGDHRQIHANNPTVRIFQVQCCVFIFFHEMCCCCWSWESPLVWHISFSTWHWHSPSPGLKELCDAYSLARREYYFDRLPLFLSINTNLAQFSWLLFSFLMWYMYTCRHAYIVCVYYWLDFVEVAAQLWLDPWVVPDWKAAPLPRGETLTAALQSDCVCLSLQLNYSFPFPTRFFC